MDKEYVLEIANLCKISFREEEIDSFTGDFQKVLKFVDNIKEVDTENVEPTYHVNEYESYMREDIVKASLTSKEATMNTKEEQYGYFKVLKIVE